MMQVVVVKWGDRYSANHVNNTLLNLQKMASRNVRFVCVTDDPEGLGDFIDVQPFPDWGDWYETMKKGCRLKLSIFVPGVLSPDLPTVFFDLDTMILGDVAKLVADVEKTGGMYMCRGHYIPWWRAMPLARLLAKNYYYYGNSPIMAFYPREFAGLPDAFKKEFGYVRWRGITHKWPLDRICKTDERFISYFARGKTRVFPRALASKFTTEYMTVGWDYSAFICRLPWVQARRRSQVALTFSGHALKPSLVKDMKIGTPVTSRHYHMTWNFPKFSQYWSDLELPAKPE